MDEQALLDRAFRIRKNLKEQGGYWAFDSDQAMQIGPEPYVLTKEQARTARGMGNTVFRFWEQAAKVYLDSCLGILPAWIAKSVEGPLTPDQHNAQMLAAGAEVSEPPLFARMDVSSLWFPVEIQERIGFLGGCTSWHLANNRAGYPDGITPLGIDDGNIPGAFASVLRSLYYDHDAWAGCPTVALVTPGGYMEEQLYFKKVLEGRGFEVVVKDRDLMLAGIGVSRSPTGKLVLDGRTIDFLYRREVNAATLATHEGGMMVLKSYLDGQLVVEPPLSMLYDTKSPFAWVHHPWLRDYFSEGVRNTIPPTTLLPSSEDAEFELAGEKWSLGKILALSNSQRKFVVKYAGPSIEYGMGGRAVYSLEDTSNVAKKVIGHALGEISEGHPWIIQPKDDQRFPTTYLDGDTLKSDPKMHARLLFFYRRIRRDVELFAAHGNFRNNWKTGGNKDAVFRVICE